MPTSYRTRATILITTGDPAGIGTEITRKALKDPSLRDKAKYIVIGDLSKSKEMKRQSSCWGGRVAIQNVEKAVGILNAIESKKALVTAPLSKLSLAKAGFKLGGHTELLSRITKSKDIMMMFCSGSFRIGLLTRHVPLKAVPNLIKTDKIVKTANLFCFALNRYFKIRKPKIGIAGLNPHAGESGVIGLEEKKIIMPAIRKLNKRCPASFFLRPADVVFRDLYERKLDGVLSMYHDQGLVPFKMLFFHNGVNMTVGLPFIRTSPDHGTAFDIAGKGIANPRSMIEAIKLAIKLS